MDETKRKIGGRKKLMLGGGVLLVICIAAAVWFGGLTKFGSHHGDTTVAANEKPSLVDLPDMVSNIDAGNRRTSFVKVRIKLQVLHAADAHAIEAAEPELVDIVQTYLREVRPDDLRGGEGTYRLREALMNRIDARLAPVQVSDLLFMQLLVQ